MKEKSRLGPHLIGILETQNHVSNSLVADYRVYHRMVNRAIGPLDVEILLNKIGALPVDVINTFFNLPFAFAASQQSPDLVFSWGVEKCT